MTQTNHFAGNVDGLVNPNAPYFWLKSFEGCDTSFQFALSTHSRKNLTLTHPMQFKLPS